VDIIAKLPPLNNIEGIISFLGHIGFYRRFIKDFSKIEKSLCNVMLKESKFSFDEECLEAFSMLK